MPRDRGLEELIRADLPDERFTEKGMFGGYAWLLHGNLVCGARADGMLVRLGKGNDGWALALPYAYEEGRVIVSRARGRLGL